MISKDVAATLKPVKRDPEPRSPLSPEEIEAMEQTDFSAQESIFVKLLRHTGLRRGEALALTAEDFDLEKKTVTVNKNLAFNECDCYIKEPKTKSAYRTVPIPSAIFDEVKSYLLSLSGNVAFPMSDGNYRAKDSFRRFWESIKRRQRTAQNGSVKTVGLNLTTLESISPRTDSDTHMRLIFTMRGWI